MLRTHFYENLPKLHALAQDETTAPSDRLKAMDLQARYGLGALQDVSMESVTAKLSATIREIQAVVPHDVATPLLERLRLVWDGKA